MFPHPTYGAGVPDCQYKKPRLCPEWGDQRTEGRGIGPRGFKNTHTETAIFIALQEMLYSCMTSVAYDGCIAA